MNHQPSIDPQLEIRLRQLAQQLDNSWIQICNSMHALCDIFVALGIENKHPPDIDTLLEDLF